MSVFTGNPIQFHQLGDQIRQMAAALSPEAFEGEFMETAGRMMVNTIRLRFATGMGPDDVPWKSSAAETQHGGRWSAKYKRSDKSLSAGSIRLFFTGAFMRSYTAEKTKTKVTVGPKGDLFVKIATRAHDDWQNYIVGWDDRSKANLDKELVAFLNRALT